MLMVEEPRGMVADPCIGSKTLIIIILLLLNWKIITISGSSTQATSFFSATKPRLVQAVSKYDGELLLVYPSSLTSQCLQQ